MAASQCLGTTAQQKKRGSAEVLGVAAAAALWAPEVATVLGLGTTAALGRGSVTVAVGDGLKANQVSLKGCVFVEGGES